jgi:hypothetical protein
MKRNFVKWGAGGLIALWVAVLVVWGGSASINGIRVQRAAANDSTATTGQVLTRGTNGMDYFGSAATQTGTHASPSTTNPLSPTWSGPLHTVYCGATMTVNLPPAATYAGRAILIYNTGAFTVTIDSDGSEVIVRDGNVQTGGVSFTLSSGAGNYVAVLCDGTRWITLGFKGNLAVGS